MASKFRNITGEGLHVNAPADHPDSHFVDVDEVLRVPGDFVETDDAYVVGKGDAARAYPKKIWAAVVDAPSNKKGE